MATNFLEHQSFYSDPSMRGSIPTYSSFYCPSELSEYHLEPTTSSASTSSAPATRRDLATPPQPQRTTSAACSLLGEGRMHPATENSPHHLHNAAYRRATSSASPCSPSISQPLTPVATELVWVNGKGNIQVLPDSNGTSPYHQSPCETMHTPASRSAPSAPCMASPASAATDWSYGYYDPCSNEAGYEIIDCVHEHIPEPQPFTYSNHKPVPAKSTYTNSLSFALSLPAPSHPQGSEASRNQSSPWTVHQPRPVRPIPIVSLSDLSLAVDSHSLAHPAPGSEELYYQTNIFPTDVHPGPSTQTAVEPSLPQDNILLFQPISPQVLAQFASSPVDDEYDDFTMSQP